jgi:hypothetical protein
MVKLALYHTVGYVSLMLFAIALGSLAVIHVYWGLGGIWPARNSRALARTVVGAGDAMPSRGACFLVAALLALGALATLGASGQLGGQGQLRVVLQVASWGFVGAFSLRGAGGFFEARFRPNIRAFPYHRWSKLVYSPLCLALATLGALELLHHGPDQT